jgi:hypothetical protein
MVFSAAGAALTATTDRPAYSCFFGSPVRLDRFTRTTRDLVAARRVPEPSQKCPLHLL